MKKKTIDYAIENQDNSNSRKFNTCNNNVVIVTGGIHT